MSSLLSRAELRNNHLALFMPRQLVKALVEIADAEDMDLSDWLEPVLIRVAQSKSGLLSQGRVDFLKQRAIDLAVEGPPESLVV
jgi:hypothetical protein